MKIVFLDRKSIGDDLDLNGFSVFGEVEMYDFSSPEEVPERVRDANIIIVNKVPVNEATIGEAKDLKLVCVTATGTNNLDKPYLDKRGIEWRNVAGYSTDCVAQHTFALLFYLYEHLPYYDNYVKDGNYANDSLFTHFSKGFHELKNKKYGIVGMGTIGRKVAEIASAFGCKVQYYSTTGLNHDQPYNEVSFDELLKSSDIISVHAPLTNETEGLFDEKAFRDMKNTAIFINVGRGAIVDEEALANAIDEGEIAGAGLDVLVQEPMSSKSPFLSMKNKNNILITPHIAWAGIETRERLMGIIYDQVNDFVRGGE